MVTYMIHQQDKNRRNKKQSKSVFNEKANKDLSEKDLPKPNSDWNIIQNFSLTFDGYLYWGSFKKCAEIANQCEEHFSKNGEAEITAPYQELERKGSGGTDSLPR